MQVQCGFRVLKCPHTDGQPMFSSEYKRSNRTRMSKILRCFPHCCPTHRPRSYCGTALHLHVTLVSSEDDQSATTTGTTEPRQRGSSEDDQHPLWTLAVPSPAQALRDFVVYGRFELHDPDEPHKTVLSLGQCVPSARITQNQDPDVIWVPGAQATSQAALDLAESTSVGPSRVFVLNEGDGESYHWEYDWRSGTSQRKRACQHQFRAYVFLPDDADPTIWQVVGMTASTPFTLSSYRKQDDEDYETTAFTDVSISQPAGISAPPQVSSPPPLPLNELLLVHQHQPAVSSTTKLAIWISFLSVIDVSWISPDILTSRAVSILRSHPDMPPQAPTQQSVIDQNLGQFASLCSMPLLGALGAASTLQPRVHLTSTAWFIKWRGLLELCIDVFCQLVMDGTLARLQSQVRRASRSIQGDEQQLIGFFVEFVTLLADDVERIVRLLSDRAYLDLLVDEIVSCVYDDDPEFDWIPKSTRELVRRLLRNTRLLGIDSYREQLRQCAVPVPPNSGFQSEISRLFSGVWSCVSVNDSSTMSRPSAAADYGLSALASVQLLTAAHSFELIMDGDATWLQLRSGWSFFSELWNVIVLDGHFHASAVLPNGVAPSLWQYLGSGAVVGDYRGSIRQVEDSSVVLDIDFFMYAVNSPSYCLQMTFVPTSSVVDRASQLQVHLRVYRTRIKANDDGREVARDELGALSPEQRSELVGFTAEDLVVALTLVYEKTL